jgi:hypothetical protein
VGRGKGGKLFRGDLSNRIKKEVPGISRNFWTG